MAVAPDDSFPRPASFGPGSVWADRSGHRSLIGRNQRGVEIPIGHGEGEINPGELLKLALIGCAGMSGDVTLARRLGEDFEMRLWAHGTSDEADNRYHRIAEEVQLPLEGLTAEEIATVVTVFERAVAAGCTVERTVVPGAEVTHTVLGAEPTVTATPDTATPDAAAAHAATPDAVTPDAAAADTATPGTATPDTAAADAATPDTAGPGTQGAPESAPDDDTTPDEEQR